MKTVYIVYYITGSYVRQTQVDGDCLYSLLYSWFLPETDPGRWRLFLICIKICRHWTKRKRSRLATETNQNIHI